ncbi:16S rRNA (uracil1498-N3)-methyltransferase [Thermosporothrix hazakensis]|jgi:16S rRNA (uracil1498-N3)-methyltransferase|uniref:Ribosomal RNA small subunit methyltransferase E n=2 Tax=Thermosporothrix TaxID=768650 RepID=A0A326UG94_THEHA|nr:16S rRNA (uracil(1498)-N(3))-methyltransferase [Thermosporothrix hazakensis]PZW36791.1 16S rRNA (uracil1498-N3)-methyltransferase [Thermosporothrix hazakensis]BBH89257.1 ribosomal RNA small subunit methyltransferase E [Thermosporothrix sp. COM3]GCE47440.1 ribosomal RNA small subunit methyltransferase E [Thermosporothrix hazakensis]
MHRFFVPPELPLQPGSTLDLPDTVAHQVRDVLRLQQGEHLVLLDNSGDEALCSVMNLSRSRVEVQVEQRSPGKTGSTVKVILCQGLLKSSGRFELILEKGTELGVTTFVPTICQRSTAGLGEVGSSKLKRWQRIVQEAAEQCGRARIPGLAPVRPFARVFDELPEGALVLMPWEEEKAHHLRTTLKAARTAYTEAPAVEPLTVVVFIGPEGGLTVDEARIAREHGAQVVSLGPRILRAETAAITAVANIMYELECIGVERGLH